MSYSIFGIHLPNGDMDIDHWADLFGDGAYTVLHPQAGCLKRLRERAPNAIILVRCYLPNWAAVDPGWWAGECAAIYAGVRPYTRHLTWANEQNLALESGGAVGATEARRATRHDYEVIHDWNMRFLDAFAARAGTADAILHYPACASGHSDDQDDDGFVGLDICRPGIDRCPVLDRHIYFTPGVPSLDRWRGVGRLDLTTALYPGKPIFVSESGNFAVTDPQSVNQYVAAGYAFQRRPEVIGWTPFIADTPDRGHDANNLSRNPAILDALGKAPKAMHPNWELPAPAPQEPPVRTLPWTGKILTVWNCPPDPQTLAAACRAIAADGVEIKVADGASSWLDRRPGVSSPYVAALKAAGLRVLGWSYNYCDLRRDAGDRGDGVPEFESDAALVAVQSLGLDGHTFDLEIECEGHGDLVGIMLDRARRTLGVPIAAHVWGDLAGHGGYPAAIVARGVDAVRPMVYRPTWTAERFWASWGAILGDTPVFPVWGITESTTAQVLTDMAVADARGCAGEAYWEYAALRAGSPLGALLAGRRIGDTVAPPAPTVDPRVAPALDALWAAAGPDVAKQTAIIGVKVAFGLQAA